MPIKSVLGIFILVTFLVSCNQKEKVESNINKYENAVLASSQLEAQHAINNLIRNFQEKEKKFETRDSALVYKPKADSAIALGNDMTDYLDSLIEKTRKQEKWDYNDRLFDKLKIYERKVLKIDTRVNEEFGEAVLYIDTLKGFKSMNSEDFYNQFIKGMTKDGYITFLNTLKCNILNFEVEIVEYLHKQCAYIVEDFEAYQCIVAQNLEQLKSNHILEIRAGIGKFEFHPNAKFIIGKKEIPINDSTDGIAVYKMKVLDVKGKHILPVKLSWTKPNGEPIVLEKDLVYYVE